jgi:hypothetical protein
MRRKRSFTVYDGDQAATTVSGASWLSRLVPTGPIGRDRTVGGVNSAPGRRIGGWGKSKASVARRFVEKPDNPKADGADFGEELPEDEDED